MSTSERSLLLESYNVKGTHRTSSSKGLSVVLAAVCIVDVFGVFPLVTLPKAIIQCGKTEKQTSSVELKLFSSGYYGILVVAFTVSMQIYTAILLGRCWLMAEELEPDIQSKNRYPYSALAEITMGKRVSYLTTFLLDISIFTAGLPNLIVGKRR